MIRYETKKPHPKTRLLLREKWYHFSVRDRRDSNSRPPAWQNRVQFTQN